MQTWESVHPQVTRQFAKVAQTRNWAHVRQGYRDFFLRDQRSLDDSPTCCKRQGTKHFLDGSSHFLQLIFWQLSEHFSSEPIWGTKKTQTKTSEPARLSLSLPLSSLFPLPSSLIPLPFRDKKKQSNDPLSTSNDQ